MIIQLCKEGYKFIKKYVQHINKYFQQFNDATGKFAQSLIGALQTLNETYSDVTDKDESSRQLITTFIEKADTLAAVLENIQNNCYLRRLGVKRNVGELYGS